MMLSRSCKTSRILHQTFKPTYNQSLITTSRQFSNSTFLKQKFKINKSYSSKNQLPQLLITGSLTGILLIWFNLNHSSSVVKNEESQKLFDQDDSRDVNKAQRSKLNETYPDGHVFIWGSNRNGIAAPGSDTEIVKKPIPLPFFQEEALRDLVLHEKYAVAVDSRGDLYQWGSGIHLDQDSKPNKILSDYDIKQIACTPYKIYALSKSGKVYIIPSGIEENRSSDKSIKTSQSNTSWWPWWLGGSNNFKPQPVCLNIDSQENQLSWREKFTSISAGDHHLLALTSKGRTFASPVDLQANSHGQLGLKQVKLNSIAKSSCIVPLSPLVINDTVSKPMNQVTPKLPWLPDDSSKKNIKPEVTSSKVDSLESTISSLGIQPEKDIHFCTTLHEVPSLRQLNVVEAACGSSHSLIRTSTGDVLAYGSNVYGQLAAGPSLLFPALPAPTEVDIPRSRDYSTKCIGLAAGGDTSYLVTEREDVQHHKRTIEVLAAGHGQYGGVGNGQWNHQASPVKVKTISGLIEWSETDQTVFPIGIHQLSTGRTHVAAVLDNAVSSDGTNFGRDVFLWGHNVDYQLGNRKRANLAIPQHILPLPKSKKDDHPSKPNLLEIESGADSPMPHHRLQLSSKKKIGKKDAEEAVVAGWDTTAVYWRLIQ
ncbi:regulator of chromosome condensation 1/beta-lactamase-inhibitor protein II [Melampsora americana]|nr:regulator of chromosome condensation 1/beta-lactamase-inhibitor protein II [Melampsora americana]